MKKTIHSILILGASSLLLACGGGSGGDNASVPATASNNTTKYLGSWNSSCALHDSIKANGATAYVIRNLDFTASSSTTLSGQFTMKVYGANDTTCKSSTLGSMSKSLVVTLSGFGTGAGGSDKVDLVMQSYAISGETVTLTQNGNTLSFASGLTKGGTSKDLVLAANNTLRWGDSSGTTTSYPTALSTDPSAVFTKQ